MKLVSASDLLHLKTKQVLVLFVFQVKCSTSFQLLNMETLHAAISNEDKNIVSI